MVCILVIVVSQRNSYCLTYDALSRRTSLTLPNGTQTTYTYDVASQVQSILHQLTATSTPINQAAYTYNGVRPRKGVRSCNHTSDLLGSRVMARPLRIEYPGAVYHVTIKGVGSLFLTGGAGMGRRAHAPPPPSRCW